MAHPLMGQAASHWADAQGFGWAEGQGKKWTAQKGKLGRDGRD
jgi:hypothetical protein